MIKCLSKGGQDLFRDTHLEIPKWRRKWIQQRYGYKLYHGIESPALSIRVGQEIITRQFTHIYLKQLKLVTRAARPSLMTSITHPISGVLDVKGAATLASASDNEIPTSAAFNAAQSLAPSPHIRTVYPSDWSRSTTSFFSSGDILAKICVLTSICEVY